MSHRVYLAIELDLADGRGINSEVLAEIVEEAMPETVEDETGSMYTATVLGLGSTIENLRESMRLRSRGRVDR